MNVCSHQKLEDTWNTFSTRASEMTAELQTPSFQASGLEKCEQINFFCFKQSGLYYNISMHGRISSGRTGWRNYRILKNAWGLSLGRLYTVTTSSSDPSSKGCLWALRQPPVPLLSGAMRSPWNGEMRAGSLELVSTGIHSFLEAFSQLILFCALYHSCPLISTLKRGLLDNGPLTSVPAYAHA